MWSTKPPLAAALKKLDSEALAAMVNAAFSLPYSSLAYIHSKLLENDLTTSQVLEEIEQRLSPEVTSAADFPKMNEIPPAVMAIQEGTAASFPLKMSHAESYLGDPINNLPSRSVLVGDAAHTIHPLAGQGLNMGLGDVASLYRTIKNAFEDGLDIGEFRLNAIDHSPSNKIEPVRPSQAGRWSFSLMLGNSMSPITPLFQLSTRCTSSTASNQVLWFGLALPGWRLSTNFPSLNHSS